MDDTGVDAGLAALIVCNRGTKDRKISRNAVQPLDQPFNINTMSMTS